MPEIVMNMHWEAATKLLSEYDTLLATKDFILDTPSLADFALAYILVGAALVSLDNAKYPNLTKWFAALQEKFPLLKNEVEEFAEIAKSFQEW